MRNGDGKPTILIVDDDLALSDALESFLSFEGFRTIVSRSGALALSQLGDLNIDAALVDVHLPDMDGLLVTQVIRVQLGKHLPVLVMSGDGRMEILQKLSDAGATYFFQKPIMPKVLVERLNQCLSYASASE